MSSTDENTDRNDAAAVEVVTLADTWQLRFDIPIDPSSSEVAREFARSWTELLEVQKLTSVVSAGIHPHEIQVQVCTGPRDDDLWDEETEQVMSILRKLSKTHHPSVQAERVEVEDGEWQGFRLWMTFDRQEAEKLFNRKKPRRRFFGSKVFKKLYSVTD